MRVGGKYRLWVPSSLAYGARGAGRMIGPNTMLVFDIEPLEVMAP
jgi:FKBP-type peptidyl-prolyl cis-trans isomerase